MNKESYEKIFEFLLENAELIVDDNQWFLFFWLFDDSACKLDMLIKDEDYRKKIASNISKLASPNASSEIVGKIKNHLLYE